jgi:hypothetical protein
MAEPLSAERLRFAEDVRLAYLQIGHHATAELIGDLILEVDRLRAALDFAERAFGEKMTDDATWIAGWKAAREQAVSAIKAKHNRKFFYTSLDPAIHAVEEMQP